MLVLTRELAVAVAVAMVVVVVLMLLILILMLHRGLRGDPRRGHLRAASLLLPVQMQLLLRHGRGRQTRFKEAL